jgi:hypothetical protein
MVTQLVTNFCNFVRYVTLLPTSSQHFSYSFTSLYVAVSHVVSSFEVYQPQQCVRACRQSHFC